MKTSVTLEEKEKILKKCRHLGSTTSYEGSTLDTVVREVKRCTGCGEVLSLKETQ